MFIASKLTGKARRAQREIKKSKKKLGTFTFIGAKMEEIYPPHAHEFCMATDNAFTPQHIFDMEKVMLRRLKWRLLPVTPYAWVNAFLHDIARRRRRSAASVQASQVAGQKAAAADEEGGADLFFIIARRVC